jgi:hypothetical protein
LHYCSTADHLSDAHGSSSATSFPFLVFFSKSCPGLELFDPRQYIRYVVEANTAMGWGGRYIPRARAKSHTTQKPLIRGEVGTHVFRGVFRASEED